RIAGALQLSGTYTDNGNAVDATGATVELQQNAQVSAAGTRFGDVTINGRYLDLDSDIYVKGDLTINNLVRLNGGTIYVAGQIVENDQVWSGTGNIQPWVTNEAPTDLVLSGTTVGENAASGTVVGTVSGTDPDAGDTTTYSLTDSAGGRFAIDATTGVLTVADGSLLNYESAASHTVTVRVTDSGGLSYDETFTINLTDVNEGPTGADATVTIDEDTSHTLTTANFGFGDVDAGDSLSAVRIDTLPTAGSLTLSGVAVTAGQVVSAADITAGHLVFTPAADANGTGYASLTFSVQDSHNSYDAVPNTLTFNVTAVNDAPVDLSLLANSVAENAATGTVVGTVTGTDPDASDTKTYSLTDTAGGRFAIDATTGVLTVADGSLLNYESAASHTVTVRVTDPGGLTYDKTFTIQVSNVQEAQTVHLERSTVDEGLVSSLLLNARTPQPGASQTVDLQSDRDNDVTEAESYLPNDVPRAAEASTNPVSPVEPLTTGHHPTQDIQELVPIHGRNGQQAASSGESATTGATDSTKSPDAPPQEPGPWPWSQSDGVETAQNESAGLGLSMAVGLTGLAWQGSQGTKEKMMSVKAQLQALHQKNPSENTSQRADENEKKEPAPEG
ncbi:MAG: hypothetical protein CV089_19990, partial [Nitrospira sp. WS110]|nr:hypothetical protein [Nitrospira sp. WS110]